MTSDRSVPAITSIERLTIAATPGLFVILWASGFIGAKLGLPYAEPLTFLFLRMFGAVLLLGVVALYARPKWPDRNGVLDSCAIGVFMHAPYLGGVYISIGNGLPAALSALIVGLQPLLTSTIANRLLGERVRSFEWDLYVDLPASAVRYCFRTPAVATAFKQRFVHATQRRGVGGGN
jgi:drug/metabolite transporter (DMT)-like permease